MKRARFTHESFDAIGIRRERLRNDFSRRGGPGPYRERRKPRHAARPDELFDDETSVVETAHATCYYGFGAKQLATAVDSRPRKIGSVVAFFGSTARTHTGDLISAPTRINVIANCFAPQP